jgi:hypothetical protein
LGACWACKPSAESATQAMHRIHSFILIFVIPPRPFYRVNAHNGAHGKGDRLRKDVDASCALRVEFATIAEGARIISAVMSSRQKADSSTVARHDRTIYRGWDMIKS